MEAMPIRIMQMKISAKNVVSKASSWRKLAPKATEGECV